MELSPSNLWWKRILECMQNNKSCLDAFWTRFPRGNCALYHWFVMLIHALWAHVIMSSLFPPLPPPDCFCFETASERARAEDFIPWRINRQGFYFSHPLRRIIWWAGKQWAEDHLSRLMTGRSNGALYARGQRLVGFLPQARRECKNQFASKTILQGFRV